MAAHGLVGYDKGMMANKFSSMDDEALERAKQQESLRQLHRQQESLRQLLLRSWNSSYSYLQSWCPR